MKKLYTVLTITFLVLCYIKSSAQATITATANSGRWNAPSTWDLNRVPANGDIIIVPGNIKVILDDTEDYSTSTLIINVFGEIEVKNNGNLSMNALSVLELKPGGRLSAHPGASSNEMIKIGGVTKFDGDDATVVGPQWANAATGITPNGFTFSTLPVKFLSFNVAARKTDVLVQWSTAEENNSSYFEIQRSVNGIDWINCGIVPAAGTSSSTRNYSFTDRFTVNGIVYYRLRQVDVDRTFTYTQVRILKSTSDTQVMIHSSTNQLFVHFSKQLRGTIFINVLNLNGQIVKRKTVVDPVGETSIATSSISNGMYVVQVTDGSTMNIARKISTLSY